MPTYLNPKGLQKVKDVIRNNRPPLVFANEILTLKEKLSLVVDGEAFIVQGGECAESVDEYNTSDMIDLFKTLIIMSLIISYDLDKPVIKIARAAGQYAKPRSNQRETIGDSTLPSYFGDIINAKHFDYESRMVNEHRILRAHDMSANTLNLIRAMSMSGYFSLTRLHEWVPLTIKDDLDGTVKRKYRSALEAIEKAVDFMKNCGVHQNSSTLSEPELYTSHEALLLDYEESMVRRDSITRKMFDCSSHFVWLGERTRNLHGPHVEFLRGIENPIGIKISKNTDLEQLLNIIDALNPSNEKGKIVLICRYGHEAIEEHFPRLLKTLITTPRNIVYMVDPMHGNTYTLPNGFKTRNFEHIMVETNTFFELCKKYGVYPGGIHLEMTGNDRSKECVNGLVRTTETDVEANFNSNCDPRLNYSQCVEYALTIASSNLNNYCRIY